VVGLFDRFEAVCRLAHYFPTGTALQKSSKALPDNRMIVY
jgi:hypothetical protein